MIDGDTIVALLDQGLSGFQKETLRLFGIDAPEKYGSDRDRAAQATFFLEHKLQGDFYVQTIKDTKGKYGRYLAKIYTKDWEDINAMMVSLGYAVFVDY